MARRFILVFVAAASVGWVAARTADLTSVELTLTEVADSQGYYLYSYDLTNPSSSMWGLATVKLDIGASSGTPNNLAVTGDLFDITASTSGDPSEAHAEVGPITPVGWEAALTRTAELWWYAPSGARAAVDSVAPGETKSGFGLRSSYLPGLAVVVAEPTPQSCCLTPVTIEGIDYRYLPREYSVSGISVAPRFQPGEVDLALLRNQLTTVCTDPLWIDDPTACSAWGDSIDAAQARAGIHNYEGAGQALSGMTLALSSNRVPSGQVEDNAYWLLKLNADHIRNSFPSDPVASVTRCAKGLETSKEIRPDTEANVLPGIGCTSVWRTAPFLDVSREGR